MRAGRPAAPGVVYPAALAVGLVAVGAGLAGLLLTHHASSAVRPAAAVAALPAPTGPIAAPPLPTDVKPVAAPVSLSIPVIDVSTRLIRLGLASSGALQVPPTAAVAGWYTGSPRPGAVGPAIIVGHIDSGQGPGVFFRLAGLRRGDHVYVRRADGTLAVFRVTSVRIYLKDSFPSQAVYGPTPDAELRLITCGGAYDPSRRSYLSNVVVYAVEVP
jgi:sortase (surface protein transpeptidase)